MERLRQELYFGTYYDIISPQEISCDLYSCVHLYTSGRWQVSVSFAAAVGCIAAFAVNSMI